MRLRSIRLRDVGPFADVDLDFEALDGPLVAVTGVNGTGKSSLLQLSFAGALYRSTPTQGTIAGRARSRKSLIEMRADSLLIRHHLDPQGAGKVLVQRNGAVVTEVESGGVRDFERWGAKALPPENLFFASIFGAPGADGFLGMTAGSRKQVILRALGIERYEELAKAALEQMTAADQRANGIAGQLQAEPLRMPVDAAERALALAKTDAVVTTREAAACRDALEVARQAEMGRALLVSKAELHEGRRSELLSRLDSCRVALERTCRRRRELVMTLASTQETRETAAELEQWRSKVAELRAQVEAVNAFLDEERRLLAAEHAASETVRDLERRRATVFHAIKDLPSTREQAGLVHGIRAELEIAERALREAREAADKADRETRGHLEAAKRAWADVRKEQDRAAGATKRIEALAGIEDAEARLERLRAALEVADKRATEIDAKVERLRSMLLDGKGERIRLLRGGLRLIATEDTSPAILRLTAKETLEEDDSAATLQEAAPTELEVAETNLRDAQRSVRLAADALRAAESLAARRPELDAAREEYNAAATAVVELTKEAHQANDLAQLHRENAATASRQATEHEATVAAIRSRLRIAEQAAERLPKLAADQATLSGIDEQLEAAKATHEAAVSQFRARGDKPASASDQEITDALTAFERAQKAAAMLPELAAAEATVRELDEQIIRESAAVHDIDKQLEALGPAPVVPPPVDIDGAEQALRSAEQAAMEATAAVATAEQRLDESRQAAERIVKLEAELREAEQLTADWALIARGYGRDGLQALEIDAAGPQLTDIVNDLLRACFGYRYTVTISTTRAKKDGSGDREVCDVLVHDAQCPEDFERDGRDFSDGQKVILGEAIRGALSVLSCRRLGLKNPTLVRDEATAVLDTDNAPAYIRMLRRMAEMVDASAVLFVSQNPELARLADSQLHVANRAVTIVRKEAA